MQFYCIWQEIRQNLTLFVIFITVGIIVFRFAVCLGNIIFTVFYKLADIVGLKYAFLATVRFTVPNCAGSIVFSWLITL